ncbi:unnamed protein product [Danaus chrysippus]|uniref:(African queen) hypothetical protein n=1 Tax=Danaus chrysippus TaxID=151541 RepID=A0A8J2QVL9_9NEOP|nr:unnamed protein product [Danaus chrysippus]
MPPSGSPRETPKHASATIRRRAANGHLPSRGLTPSDQECPPAWRACLITRGLTPYPSHPSPRGQSPTTHRRAQAPDGRQRGNRPTTSELRPPERPEYPLPPKTATDGFLPDP